MTTPSPSSHEHVLRDDELLVIVIDKAGRFVYANPAYLAASGYSWEELKGRNSSTMLHTDVPMEVSIDMSETLKLRTPWTGIIKNQRKDGSSYWCRLNISAVYHGNAYAGGLLVHSKVTPDEIARFDPLYRAFREKRAKHLKLRNGEPVPSGWRGRLHDALHLNIRGRIVAALSLMNVGAVATIFASAGEWTSPLAWGASIAYTGVNLGVGWMMVRSILTPLNAAVRMANRIAGGDLQMQALPARNDEIGAAIRAITQVNMNMRATVIDVRGGVESVGRSAGEIASGNQDLSARTETQASSLEETAAAIEELASTVRQSADSASQANELALATSAAAEQGGQVVSQVVSTMNEISRSSKKIADIVGVIDAIAFQTNILALNAAVEAARAGEQGRGFAVVAGEVRNLAQRSAQSAKEIKSLISGSVERIETGAKLVNDAGRSMESIVGQVKRVTELVGQIALAAREQSSGIGQVNQAVAQLDQMTQQNAAMVEESAAAAESVAAQVQRLTQAVSVVFKLSAQDALAMIQMAKGVKNDMYERAGGAAATGSVSASEAAKAAQPSAATRAADALAAATPGPATPPAAPPAKAVAPSAPRAMPAAERPPAPRTAAPAAASKPAGAQAVSANDDWDEF